MEQLKHFIKTDKKSKNKKLSEMTEEEKNKNMQEYFSGEWRNYTGGKE